MKGDTRPRVAGYVRVSTEEQARGGSSLDAQEQKIRAYCQLYELELVVIVGDPGESGKSLDRPGVKVLLEDLRRKRIDGVVIAKLDRLTRSIRDWAGLIEEFFSEKAGRRLFSVNDSIDTRSASGRLVLNVLMTVAQWEREIIGERTHETLQSKIARGERCGKVRFGYDLGPDGKHLVPNDAEQAVIHLLRDWRTAGRTYRDLVATLESMGIETKEGGRVWRPATIKRILERTA